MPDTPALARRDGVELVRTGRWAISSGTWEPKPQDLIAAVAALNCPAVRRPIIKIGHSDPRFRPGDGEPALGWIDNLRLADGGHTLVGDYVGVPAWLDTVMASAYPDRSVEGEYRFQCQLGHRHPFVLTAVSLLGVTPPGVGTLKSLQDVQDLYGVAATPQSSVPVSVVIVAGKGDEALKRYWLHGEGLRKWATSAHPWTALYNELKEHVGAERARRIAAQWYFEHFGHWPGSKRGDKK